MDTPPESTAAEWAHNLVQCHNILLLLLTVEQLRNVPQLNTLPDEWLANPIEECRLCVYEDLNPVTREKGECQILLDTGDRSIDGPALSGETSYVCTDPYRSIHMKMRLSEAKA